MLTHLASLIVATALSVAPAAAATKNTTPAAAGNYFTIEVIDQETGRGVPLVELRTTDSVRRWTDSAGLAAIDEPGLFGQKVFFHVASHGYEFPKDGFGYFGVALDVTRGGKAQLKIKRINIAQRMYRITGGGIYRDSVLVGRKTPLAEPLLNAQVFGSDSVQTAVYRGKLYWFWGDTLRPRYPLGNFHAPGATSRLPADGGLDPEQGVDLEYFVGEDGFARPCAQMPGEGPTWIDGAVTVPTADGERLFTAYMKVRGNFDVYQRGLARWDDDRQRFAKVREFDLDAPVHPGGHAFLHTDGGTRYVYFGNPYPLVRVRADAAALADLAQYEVFTCLTAGSRLTVPGKNGVHVDRATVERMPVERAAVDRDATEGGAAKGGAAERDKKGAPRWAWKKDAPAISPEVQDKLIAAGKLQADEGLLPLRDADSGKAVRAHTGSVAWNDYRHKWVMIALQVGGSSMLGEIWYAEADSMLGAWVYARKVVTHDRYSFYNPMQHPEFAKNGGRTIFFEGTYTASFSGNSDLTPRYEYNQIMYKLELNDPRLALPVPIYREASVADAGVKDVEVRSEPLSRAPDARKSGRVAFFAMDRPFERLGERSSVQAVPVYASKSADGAWQLTLLGTTAGDNGPKAGQKAGSEKNAAAPAPLFYALPGDMENPPATTAPLYEFVSNDGPQRVYTTDESWTAAGFQRNEKPLCRVWKNPCRFWPPDGT
jgi:hypothetical protein